MLINHQQPIRIPSNKLFLKNKVSKSGKIDLTKFGSGERVWITLKNGMRVVLCPIQKIDMVSIYLRVGAGSVYEGEFMGSGISHFVEHSVFLGSKNFPEKDQFSKTVEGYGAIDFNAYTTTDHTAYFFSVFSKYLDLTLKGLYDFIYYPTFEPEAVADEKGTIFSEMDMYHDHVNDWYYHYLQTILHPEQPYKYPVIGVRKKFDEINAEELAKYHRNLYRPNNIVLSLVGKFDIKEMTKLVTEIFDKNPTATDSGKKVLTANTKAKSKGKDTNNVKQIAPNTYQPFPEELFPNKLKTYQTTHPRAKYIKSTWVWKGVGLSEPKSEDRIGLEILTALLAWDKGSLLYDELKEKLKLVKNISAYSNVNRENGFFSMSLSFPKKVNLLNPKTNPKLKSKSDELVKLRQVVKEIEKIIADCLKNFRTLLTDDMLEGIKSSFLKSHFDEQERNLEQAISLSESLVDFGDLIQDQLYLKEINQLTVDDLTRLVKKYLLDSKGKLNLTHQIFLLPSKTFKAGKVFSSTKARDEYEDSLYRTIQKGDFTLAKTKNLKVKPVSKVSLGGEKTEETKTHKTNIASNKLLKRLKKNKQDNQNKFQQTLLTYPSSRFPKSYLILRFAGGVQNEGNHIFPGSYHLLSNMFFTSNQSYRKLELYQQLKQQGIGYQGITGETSVGLAFSFLNSKFDQVMDILEGILTNPKFNQSDLAYEKKETIYHLDKFKENVDYLAAKYFKELFFAGTRLVYSLEGDEKSLKKISTDNLMDLKNQMFSKQVISLYGSYHPSEQTKLVEWMQNITASHYENSQNSQEDLIKNLDYLLDPKIDDPIHNPISSQLKPFDFKSQGLVKRYEKNFNQSIFYMGFRVSSLGHEDNAALEVLNSYLSGLGGPLFKLRSEGFKNNGKNLGGRAYRLGSQYKLSKLYGMFGFHVNFRTEAKNEHNWAIDSFLKVLNSLAEKPIPIIELSRAKNTLMAKNLINSMKLLYQAKQENLYEFIGNGYQTHFRYQKQLLKVTPQDIQRVVKKYFDENAFVAQIVLPK